MAWTPQWSASLRWELFLDWGDGNFLLPSGIKCRLITQSSHEWGLAELACALGACLIRDAGGKGMGDLRYRPGEEVGCDSGKPLAEYFLHFWGDIGPLDTEQVGKDTTQRDNNLPVAAPSKPELLRQLYNCPRIRYTYRSSRSFFVKSISYSFTWVHSARQKQTEKRCWVIMWSSWSCFERATLAVVCARRRPLWKRAALVLRKRCKHE